MILSAILLTRPVYLVVLLFICNYHTKNKKYRSVSLTSAVCKQTEHVIAGYIRQVWEDWDWLYKGQHGFRPGYSCESQIITVCQDIPGSLNEAARLDAIIIDFSKVLIYSLTTGCLKSCSLGHGFKSGGMDLGISDRSFSES